MRQTVHILLCHFNDALLKFDAEVNRLGIGCVTDDVRVIVNVNDKVVRITTAGSNTSSGGRASRELLAKSIIAAHSILASFGIFSRPNRVFFLLRT